MPVTVKWYDTTHTLLYLQFEGEWGWPDYRGAMTQAAQLAATQTHRVDYLGDFRHSHLIPGGALREVQHQFAAHPSNWGCTLIVQNNVFLRLLAETFRRLFPYQAERYLLFTSVEDALAYLWTCHHEQSLTA